jgi:hypothetical protein
MYFVFSRDAWEFKSSFSVLGRVTGVRQLARERRIRYITVSKGCWAPFMMFDGVPRLKGRLAFEIPSMTLEYWVMQIEVHPREMYHVHHCLEGSMGILNPVPC